MECGICFLGGILAFFTFSVHGSRQMEANDPGKKPDLFNYIDK